MIEISFRSILAAAVEGIVGSRVYPLVLPENVEYPSVVYTFIGGSSKATQDTYGSQRYRVQVDCWGSGYKETVALRHAIILSLSQYNAGGVFIQLIQPRDLFDQDRRRYRAMVEFYVYSNLNSN